MYKVSIDGINIVECPKEQALFTFIKSQTGAQQVIMDSFTSLDLKTGDSKKLLLHKGQYNHVFAGKNLTKEDLVANYDSFGSINKK